MTVLSPAARDRSRSRFPSLPRTRSAVLGATVVAVLAGLLVSPGPAAADAAVPAGRFVPVGPVRVLDTADNNRPFGSQEWRTVDLSKALPNVPVSAVVINLAAADPTKDSYQTAYPTGTPLPNAASLNVVRGQTRGNSVTVAVGQGGANQNKINIFNQDGSVRIVVDVYGYYTLADPGVATTAYVPLKAPTRLFDSRVKPGPLTRANPVGNATVDYGDPSLNKVIKSVLVNLAVTQAVGPGFITVWDGNGAKPNTSALNFGDGQTVANLVNVPVRCADSKCNELTFSMFSSVASSVQVIGDLQGAYVVPGQAGSLVFRPVSPTRIVDTRRGMPWPTLGQAATGTVSAPSSWSSDTRAVALNVTMVLPTQAAFVSVWATGSPRPGASNINAPAGGIVPNAVQTRVGPNGTGFQILNNAGNTDVVVDYAGAFVPDPTAPTS